MEDGDGDGGGDDDDGDGDETHAGWFEQKCRGCSCVKFELVATTATSDNQHKRYPVFDCCTNRLSTGLCVLLCEVPSKPVLLFLNYNHQAEEHRFESRHTPFLFQSFVGSTVV